MSRVIKNHTGHSDGKFAVKLYQKFPTSTIAEPVQADTSHIVEKELETARLKAEQIINEAKIKAAQLEQVLKEEREDLAAEREKALEAAYKEGYESGIEQGKKQGYREVENQIQNANEIVEMAQQEYEKYIGKSEQTILTIALKVAEKILNHSINEDEKLFLPIVKKAIEEARDYLEIYVYIHPTFYPLLIEQQEELFAPYLQDKQIYIYPDDKLKETDCIIETAGGRIIASLDSQFTELKEKLFEIFMGGHE